MHPKTIAQLQGPDLVAAVIQRLSGVLLGKEKMIELSVAAFLARGHILLEGPPGTGKTSLGKSLASVFGGTFKRIQMTSDLMPSDIMGFLRLKPGTHEFEFRPGPLFTNFLLTDELNRTSPKTQGALLEAMAEGTVTIDGTPHLLPSPFFVIATQNPFEYQGVFPLPESELDRFMLKLPITAPERSDELQIYENHLESNRNLNPPKASLEVSPAHLGYLFKKVSEIYIERSVLEYATEIVRATRLAKDVSAGASVRGGLQFLSVAQALAFIRGRDFVIPQDFLELAVPTLAHRLSFFDGDSQGTRANEVIREILEKVPPPK